jgi:hypothetical protein
LAFEGGDAGKQPGVGDIFGLELAAELGAGTALLGQQRIGIGQSTTELRDLGEIRISDEVSFEGYGGHGHGYDGPKMTDPVAKSPIQSPFNVTG